MVNGEQSKSKKIVIIGIILLFVLLFGAIAWFVLSRKPKEEPVSYVPLDTSTDILDEYTELGLEELEDDFAFGDIKEIELKEEHSDNKCFDYDTFGLTGDEKKVWVTDGCVGIFSVTGEPDTYCAKGNCDFGRKEPPETIKAREQAEKKAKKQQEKKQRQQEKKEKLKSDCAKFKVPEKKCKQKIVKVVKQRCDKYKIDPCTLGLAARVPRRCASHNIKPCTYSNYKKHFKEDFVDYSDNHYMHHFNVNSL